MGANNPVCTFRNFAYAINGFRNQKPNSISLQCQALACGLSETRSSASIYIAPERIRAGRNIIRPRCLVRYECVRLSTIYVSLSKGWKWPDFYPT